MAREISKILNLFIKMYNEENNIQEGRLITTIELDEKQVQKIETLISKKLDKKVILETKVDQNIIGGIRMEINDLTWDYTIKGQLNDLAKTLVSSGIENKEEK